LPFSVSGSFFDEKRKRHWVLYSSFDMAMKFVMESKDGFGMSMHTGKNTGLVMIDWTYKITQEKIPCIVRSCRAQTPALQPQLLHLI